MTTSSASFSPARAAIRRACSSEVRALSVATKSGRQPRPVKPVFLDVPGDGRRNEAVERLAGLRATADLGRGNRMGLQFEDLDAWRGGRRRVTRTRGDPEPRQLEHPLRVLPGRECGQLVGADQEDRVVVAGGLERVDGIAVRLQLDGCVELGERELGHGKAVLDRRLGGLVRRVGDDRDVEVVDAEARHGRLRERDVAEVRRVEPAAEDADLGRHCDDGPSSRCPGWCEARTQGASIAALSTRLRTPPRAARGASATRRFVAMATQIGITAIPTSPRRSRPPGPCGRRRP